jgi:flagellar basal body-associated protein FliL
MEYTAPTYKPVVPVKVFSSVPSFNGKATLSDVVETIVSGDMDQSIFISYGSKLIFVAGFIISIWIVWVVSLMFLKCFRCGISAGRAFVSETGKPNMKQYVFRWTMIGSALVIAITSIVYISVWASRANSIYDDFDEALLKLDDWINNVTDPIDSMIEIYGNVTGELYNDFVQYNADATYCPQINTVAGEVINTLQPIKDFDITSIEDINSQFSGDVSGYTTDMDNALENTESARIVAIAEGVPVLILSLLFAFGAYMTSRWSYNGYYVFQKWVLNTLLFILVFIVMLIAAATGMFLTINSDICGGSSGGPEALIRSLLNSNLITVENYTSQAIDYYILDACQNDSFFVHTNIDDLIDLVNSAMDAVDTAIAVDYTGCSSSVEFIASLSELSSNFGNLVLALQDIKSATGCEGINSIFVKFFHDGICSSIPLAFAWIFGCSVMIWIFGTYIFTFRGALLPLLTERGWSDTGKQTPYYSDENKLYETTPY